MTTPYPTHIACVYTVHAFSCLESENLKMAVNVSQDRLTIPIVREQVSRNRPAP